MYFLKENEVIFKLWICKLISNYGHICDDTLILKILCLLDTEFLADMEINAEVVNFWGLVEAIGLPAIQRGGCPTEK